MGRACRAGGERRDDHRLRARVDADHHAVVHRLAPPELREVAWRIAPEARTDLLPYHLATRRTPPGLAQRSMRRLMRVLLLPFRPQVEGIENVPAGPVVLAANHGSYWDHFFLGIFVRREINFMTAAEFFPNRVIGTIMQRVGSFPVRRGAADTDALETAAVILARGGLVVIYPEGGVCKHGEISERPRPGVGGLALRNGAQVVPVAIHPATSLHKLGFLRLPRVTVRFGPPIPHAPEPGAERERQQEAAERIWADVVDLYGATERAPAAV